MSRPASLRGGAKQSSIAQNGSGLPQRSAPRNDDAVDGGANGLDYRHSRHCSGAKQSSEAQPISERSHQGLS